MQASLIPNNNVANIADVLNDTQQPGKKANRTQALAPAGGALENVPVPAVADVTVTLSAVGIAAAATAQASIPAGNGNTPAVQQSQANQNAEAAQAIRAYNNSNQAAVNNNENMTQNQQPPRQIEKIINRLGGA
ncbi:MAG: hypothetical protein ACLQF0_01880 [Dissulfurispiraceae bacterium]